MSYISRVLLTLIGTLALVQLGGCAYSNATAMSGPAAAHPPQADDAIGVIWAKDPEGETYPEPGPGRTLGDITLSLVQRKFPSARIIETRDDNEALNRAAKNGVAYLVAPRILQWGNFGSISSRLAGRVAVELRLLQVSTHQLVKTIRYEGSNNSVTLGSNVPEALLDENFADAVADLLRRP